MEKHSIGPWYVVGGSMFNRYGGTVMLDEDIAIIIDSCPEEDRGVLLKVGRYDDMALYLDKLGPVFDTVSLIRFNVMFEGTDENPDGFKPDGYNFTVDEICTIINWFGNCIGGQMGAFLSLPLDEAKKKIESLQQIGF